MNQDRIKSLQIKSCLDVGANVGQFYTMMKEINPKIYIESIEPNPNSVARFKKNHPQAIIHECGAGETESVLKFYIDKRKSCSKSASFVGDFLKGDKDEIMVPVRCLDIIAKDRDFELLKIDVEGFEFEVLKGAINTMKNSKYVLVEMAENSNLINLMRNENFYAVEILNKFRHLQKKYLMADVLFIKGAIDQEIKMEDYFANTDYHL
jgi:FkbM family methyltransferase